MAEVESAKYTNKHRNKAHSRSQGRLNRPARLHPGRSAGHEAEVEYKQRRK